MKQIKEKIMFYINNEFRGGLITLKDLMDYTGEKKIALLHSLFELSKEKVVELEKRYFCPNGDFIRNECKSYCQECDYDYDIDLINVTLYIEPKKIISLNK